MHENETFVWVWHFGASKTYGRREHANANTILEMKVINELEHGHKSCGIQVGDTSYFVNYDFPSHFALKLFSQNVPTPHVSTNSANW